MSENNLKPRPSPYKIATICTLSAFFSLAVWSSAAASSGEINNSNTGSDSTNNTSIASETTTTVNITDTANVSNNINISGSTGDFSVNNNTTVGDVQSGDIAAEININNELNTDSVDLSDFVSAENDNFSVSNSNTGAGSDNSTEINLNNSVAFNQTQEANIENDLLLSLSTGGFNVSNNTSVGDITSGSINVQVGINNRANTPDNPDNPVNPDGNGGGGQPTSNDGWIPDGWGGGLPEVFTSLFSESSSTEPRFFAAGSSLSHILILLLLLVVPAVLLSRGKALKEIISFNYAGRPAALVWEPSR